MPPAASKKVGLWPYPRVLDLRTTPEMKNLLCYVMKHYGNDGVVALVERRKTEDDVELRIQFGDWKGEEVDIHAKTKHAAYGLLFMDRYVARFLEIMKLVGMPLAQFYLVPVTAEDGTLTDLMLTDLRTGPSKFTGPGMVRDIFGASIQTPTVIKIAGLTDDLYDMIDRGLGSYACDLILKPSRFRTVEKEATLPLFAEVCR